MLEDGSVSEIEDPMGDLADLMKGKGGSEENLGGWVEN
jgi:hypothetical protein